MTERAKDIEDAESAREKAYTAYENARRKAVEKAYGARETARKAGERARGGIEAAPVAALLGAAAVGALAGALLPTTEKEADVLGPLGNRVTGAGKAALSAASEAGRETLGGFGVNKQAAQSQFDRFLDIAVQTILVAGEAAAKARRN